ncbi:Undecaprenyl-phosphate 4-deoxy-4-formamido-L-arabinose transferase [subsurface metagenome]
MENFKGKISVIIPAYNEGDNIENTIKETIKVFEQVGSKYEIIVVDDGSEDDTFLLVKKVSDNNDHVKVIKCSDTNMGKGFAIKSGFEQVSGDLVVFMDADLDLHPEQIRILFKHLKEKDADVAIGSKRHPDSIVDYPWYRKIMSDVYYLLILILFNLPIRDTQTGLKMFKYKPIKEAFKRILVKRFAFDLELLLIIHKLGYKIIDAPVKLVFKPKKFRSVGLNAIFHVLWDTAAIFYRLYILKFYKL